MHENRLLDDNIDAKTELHVDKRDPSKRPVIFTASSILPTPISGYKSFGEQVGGHLSVQDSPCLYYNVLCCYLFTIFSHLLAENIRMLNFS